MTINPLESELRDARRQTDELFQIVRGDSFYERPIPERHRIIFYLGHLEAFDWNLVARHALDLPAFHSEFDRLFAFGIDPPEGQLPGDEPADWPAIAEVERYSRRVREAIDRMLPEVSDEILHAAIEHRLMHAETLAYIVHQLPYDRKHGGPVPARGADRVPIERMIEIPRGPAQLGYPGSEGFAWDNEYRAHTVDVPAFAVSQHKVTNADYLEFVREGGPPPLFWIHRDGVWLYRGMFAEVPLPLSAPVYVTKCQAEAYARSRGMALPTESQFQRASAGLPSSRNVDFRFWDPIPVTADGNAKKPQQMTGNGWEWTSTVFGPFPGFEPKPYYRNYSAPFFDGQHYVLKGGSPRTAARFLRPSFRNWFRPSYPYVYATFRLVAS
jgi:formylglycine-generating enzyme required for sulfatase activity